MNKERNRALLVIIFFLLLFSVVPLSWHQTGDFNFHFNKAGERCIEGYSAAACSSYYPLLHFLGSAFSFSPHAFSNYLMVLLLFVTPIILFFTTKKWIAVWLYFSATQYAYTIQAGGAYPQALAGILLLLFLWQKHYLFRVLLLVVALLAHSQAFVLLLLIWLVQLFFENNVHSILFKKFKNVFPACSAIFGVQEVDPIGQKVPIQILNKNILAEKGINLKYLHVKDIGNFFVRTFPLPFLIMAFWQLRKEKNWALIVLTGIMFYMGIASAQTRVFLMIPLLLIPSLTRFYYNLDSKWKKWFILLTLITFAINFGTWFLYKLQCLN